MDYKSLLSLAEKKVKDSSNDFLIKKRPKEGQTSGPNKSVIEAFKARKEKEEMERHRERQREKDRLMTLRAQNSKSMKKAKMMKTRTKDNDFSRIVLTDQQIEEQKRVEEKLKRKGTQDLIQNKKSRNELEDKLIKNGAKNLKNNNISNYSQNNGLNSKCDKTKDNQNKSNNENQMKSRNQKPVMSYEQLLSLATEKAKSEKKSLTEELMSEIEEKKPMRPMTQKEKDKLREEMYYKQRAHKGMAKLPDPEQIKKNNSNSREVKKNTNSSKKPNTYEPNIKYGNNKLIPKTITNSITNSSQKDIKTSDKSINNNNNINNYNINNNNLNVNKKPIDRTSNVRREAPLVRQDSRKLGTGSATNKSEILNKMNSRLNSRDKEYNERYLNASKERQKISNNSPQNRPQNKNINERARPPSPPPMRKLAPKLPPIGNSYRRGMYEDVSQYVDNDYDEDEEDDDMSDFIDDGPEEKPIEEDYSRAIREIFGYDKRKYRNIDDDDDIEEANFVQCMKEDARSARIGLLEDLEEERKEQEEIKRKALIKKRLKN